jgi:hypothetical protein
MKTRQTKPSAIKRLAALSGELAVILHNDGRNPVHTTLSSALAPDCHPGWRYGNQTLSLTMPRSGRIVEIALAELFKGDP